MNKVDRVLDIAVQDKFMCADLLRSCLGNLIGSGMYRDVYEWPFDKKYVLKVANEPEKNFIEYEVYKCAIGAKLEKWFAPVHWISPGGHYMLMRKTRPVKQADSLIRKCPAMFADRHIDNFGFIGKQLVIHDYHFLQRQFDFASNVDMMPLKFI